MIIRVFVQNEAGSMQTHYHDEKTLTYLRSAPVAHAYPYPYGFILGTEARDGCNVFLDAATAERHIVENTRG